MSDKAKTRYNDSDLAELRAIIEKKIVKAEEDLALLREQFANDMNMVQTIPLLSLNHLKRALSP